MKYFISGLVLSLFCSSMFAQQGINYSLDLLDIENLNKRQNISFQNNQLLKAKNKKDLVLTTREIEIEQGPANNPFIALSVAKDFADSNDDVSLSYKENVNDTWTAWIAIQQDDHTQHFKQVYLDQQTTAIQFKLEADGNSTIALSSLNYRLYYPGATTSHQQNEVQAQHKDVSCSCPLPSIEYRSDWCPSGNCPQDLTPTATTVTHLVVHHSAGSNTSPDWAATVRAIWDFHTSSNGWDDIGYNYLIDPNGVIYEGRGNDVQGAHFSCMNQGTMGVCLLGNFDNVVPSTAMINALTTLMGWKACDIDEDPRDTTYFNNGAVDLINLCGHRDGNNIPASCTTTACPGANVYAIMDNLRSNIYNFTQSCTLSPSYADIVVLDMSAGNAPIVEDETTQLLIDFKNVGDAAVNENLNISFRIEGNEIGTSSFSSMNINQSLSRSVSYTFDQPGLYQYCAFIDGGSNELNVNNNSFCIDLNVEAKQDTSTSVLNLNLPDLKIYPNPSSGMVYADGEKNYDRLILYNALGQALLSQEDFPVDLSPFDKGVYYLKFIGKDLSHYKAIPLVRH